MVHQGVFSKVLRDGIISRDDSILAVCAGTYERELFLEAGFPSVTISNVDSQFGTAVAPYQWSYQDVEALNYPDGSFDVVFVHAGLHHCHSPHRALLEMYRAARKAVVVIESRDSFSMRIARRLGLTADYEIEAVSDENFESGGVRNGPIPNYVYRWTEREIDKLIRSFEPRFEPILRFYYGLKLPHDRLKATSRTYLGIVLRAVEPLAILFAAMFPRQGNEFAFVAIKKGPLQPWLVKDADGTITISREAVASMRRTYRRTDSP